MLKTKNSLFQTYFEDFKSDKFSKMSDEDIKTLEDLFKATFPNHPTPLHVFRCEWVVDKVNQDFNLNMPPSEENVEECRDRIYDSCKRKFVRPQVLPPGKRRRSPTFNAGEFIRQKRLDGDCFEISLQDRDMVEDLLEELSDDKARNYRRADVALNSIVSIVHWLHNILSYRIVELHPEKNIG